MKKKDLQSLVLKMISEALTEAMNTMGKSKATSHYRRSKLHPGELTQSKTVKMAKAIASEPKEPVKDVSSVLEPILASIESLPAPMMQVVDPKSKKAVLMPNAAQHAKMIQTAEVILLGQPVPKKDVTLLARYILASKAVPGLALNQILKALVSIHQKS